MRKYFYFAGIILLSLLGTTVAFAQPRLSWEAKAPLSPGRAGLALVTFKNKIYALGGQAGERFLSRVEVYNPKEDEWTLAAPMPTERAYLAAVVYKGKVLALGGWDGTSLLDVVEEYDPQRDTWEKKEPMPLPLMGHGAAVVGNKIYILGGESTLGYVEAVMEYDPEAEEWAPYAAIPAGALAFAGVASWQNKIYLVGGWQGKSEETGSAQPTIWEFDPKKNHWKKVSNLGGPRAMMGITVVDGILYIAGGRKSSSERVSSVETYDIGKEVVRYNLPIIEAREALGLAALSPAFYAVGGKSGQKFFSINAEGR